jgi:hypothetical protein
VPVSARLILAIALGVVGTPLAAQLVANGRPDYDFVAAMTAFAMVAFRVIVGLGRRRPSAAPVADVKVAAPPPGMTAILIAGLAGLTWLWLAQPTFANDCPSDKGTIEAVTCFAMFAAGTGIIVAGAMIALMAELATSPWVDDSGSGEHLSSSRPAQETMSGDTHPPLQEPAADAPPPPPLAPPGSPESPYDAQGFDKSLGPEER